jgi:hypothetical protein
LVTLLSNNTTTRAIQAKDQMFNLRQMPLN